MNTKERIMAIRLREKARRQPEFSKRIGIAIVDQADSRSILKKQVTHTSGN